MYIDTHAHINFSAFKEDASEVIQRSLDGETWMILPSSDYKSSRRALEYANKYDKGVYASVGLHPISINGENGEEFNYGIYEELASHEKVVAIGEIGLDYYHLDKEQDIETQKKKQKKVFVEQLELAYNLDLPVIIHCREAHNDMVAILTDFRNKNSIPRDKVWGVMHCFSGDEDLAWQYFNLGIIISFTGLITFNNAWDGLIRKMPLDKIMIETDSPYMAPEPFRGKRNEPEYVKYVVERVAQVKGMTTEEIGQATTKNAKNLFNI